MIFGVPALSDDPLGELRGKGVSYKLFMGLGAVVSLLVGYGGIHHAAEVDDRRTIKLRELCAKLVKARTRAPVEIGERKVGAELRHGVSGCRGCPSIRPRAAREL